MPFDQTRASKLLAYLLRHAPAAGGLTLDSAGWAPVTDVLKALTHDSTLSTLSDLAELVAASDKERFAFSADGRHIRANQGHSVPVDLGLEPRDPPAVLLQGTVSRFVDAIRREGLRTMERHAVHLSADHQTAIAVARRRGAPVVIRVDAGQMLSDGFLFYCSANGVWLTEHVPPKYLDIPES